MSCWTCFHPKTWEIVWILTLTGAVKHFLITHFWTHIMLFSLTLVLFVSCVRVAGWVWLVLMHPHHFPPQDKVLDQTIGKCPNRLTRPEEAVDLKTGLWSTFMCVCIGWNHAILLFFRPTFPSKCGVHLGQRCFKDVFAGQTPPCICLSFHVFQFHLVSD